MTYIENKLKHEINFFRLSKEYEKLGKDLPKGVSVSLPSESDMYTWDAVIEGPEDSLYKGITLVYLTVGLKKHSTCISFSKAL